MSSADKVLPISGLTKHRARSGSKLFDSLMVFLKEFFEKVEKFTCWQRVDKNTLFKLPNLWYLFMDLSH